MGAVYRRLEVLGGVWKELPPRRQWVTGALVGVAVGGYLIHLALVRTLNSVMLSINTFSTLGFGDIPVRGWIRYAAIAEGFLGWFLLSIFSVSLISQILQV